MLMKPGGTPDGKTDAMSEVEELIVEQGGRGLVDAVLQ